jgi:hypothetical protein
MNASEDLQQFQLAKLQLPNMRFCAGRGFGEVGVPSRLTQGVPRGRLFRLTLAAF